MATPCVITYEGKKHTYDEFAFRLHDGLLEDLSSKGVLDNSIVEGFAEAKKNMKETATTEAATGTEVTPKTTTDATQERIIEKSNLTEYQNRDESRTPESPGDRNRNVKSGQEQEEVTSAGQEQAPAPIATSDNTEALKRISDKLGVLKMPPERGIAQAPLRTLFKRTVREIDSAVKNGEITRETAKRLTDEAVKARDKRISEPVDEATSRIIMALRKMNITSGGEGVTKSGMDLESLINFGAEVYKRAVAKGMDVSVAVDRAVEAMKNSKLWATFGSKEIEDRVRNEFGKGLQEEKTAQTTESSEELTSEVKQRKSAGLKRLLESERITPELKAKLTDEGVHYAITEGEVKEGEADEIVKYAVSQGQTDALYNDLVNRDVKFKEPLARGLVSLSLFEHYHMNPGEGTNEKMVKLANEASRIATYSGATSSIIGKFNKRIAEGTEEGMLSYAEAQAKDEAAKIYNGDKKANDAVVKKINAGIEEEKATTNKEVSPEKKKAASERRKALMDKFRSLPSAKPKVVKESSIERVKNTAEVLKTYLEEGETANAVSKFRRDYEKALGEKPSEEMITRALEEVVDGKPLKDIITGERKINRIISDKFSSMSDKVKLKLTAEVSQYIGESGKITTEQFKEAYTEAMKGDILTDDAIEQMKKDRLVTIEADKKKNDINKSFDNWKDAQRAAQAEGRVLTKAERKAFMKEIAKKDYEYRKAVEKAAEARMNTAKRFIKPDIWKTTESRLRGGFLSFVTGSANIVANAVVTPFRFMVKTTAGMADYLYSKVGNDVLGAQTDRSMNPLAEAYGMTKFGTRFALWKTWRRLINGSAIEGEKIDLRPPGLNFVDAWKGLVKGRQPGETRFKERKLTELMGAGPRGALADLVTRYAAVPDYFGRTMAEIGRAHEIAKTKTKDGKPLSEAEVWEKTIFPDEKDLATISKAGKKAVYMQQNEIAQSVQQIGNKFLTDLADNGNAGRHIAGFIRVLKAGLFPFTTVPLNLIGELISFTVPEAGMLGGAIDMIKSRTAEKAGDHEKALDYRRSATVNFSKSLFAIGASSVVGNLIRYGLVQPATSAGDKPGDKAAAFAYTHPGTFNWSAIQRKMSGDDKWYEIKDDDTWCSFQKLGTIGMIMGTWADIYRHDSQHEVEETNPLYDAFVSTPVAALGTAFDQSFLKSESDFLATISNPNRTQSAYWVANYGVGLSKIFIPNTLTQISKGSDDLLRDTRGNSAGEIFLNNMKNSLFMGGELPSKVTLWGDDIKSAPAGTNPYYYYTMSVMKSSSYEGPEMGRKLFDFYRTTDDDDIRGKIWPKTPSSQISIGGNTVQLNASQFHEYQVLVGKQREMETGKYVMYGSFDEDSPEVRAKKLNKIYSACQSRAKKMLIMGDPKLMSALSGVDLTESE